MVNPGSWKTHYVCDSNINGAHLAIVGFILGFSDTWLLIINTIATINASLMVIIIQNTQNRESKAMHLKLDELIISIKEAENALVAIEEIEEEELEALRKQVYKKGKIE